MNSFRVKQLAGDVGFDVCGIAKPDTKPEAEKKFEQWIADGKHAGMHYLENFRTRAHDFWQRFPDAKSVIVLGVNYYSQSTPEKPGPLFGRVARYAWGKDYHEVIRKKLEALVSQIKLEVPAETRFELSVDTKPIFERHFAERARLGFIGKQTHLISPEFGPWLFLSEIITNLDLEPDEPHQGSCGTCRRCIDACPTKAISETGSVDARRCIAYLTIEHKGDIPSEFHQKIGGRIFGCDECLNVCPYTAKQKESKWKEFKPEAGTGPWLDLEKLSHLKMQRDYENFFRGTALLRAKRNQLLRNARIVLSNTNFSRQAS